LTQEDLTRLVQDLTGGMLRRPNLSKIENDNYGEAGAWVVVALSKALRTSPDYLLGFTDDPTPNADPDAILRSMDEQDRAIVRRLAALVDGMTIEQKIAMLSFAENFIAGSVNHPAKETLMPLRNIPLAIILQIADSIVSGRRVYLILSDTGPRLLA
jgi:hypothetical protein